MYIQRPNNRKTAMSGLKLKNMLQNDPVTPAAAHRAIRRPRLEQNQDYYNENFAWLNSFSKKSSLP